MNEQQQNDEDQQQTNKSPDSKPAAAHLVEPETQQEQALLFGQYDDPMEGVEHEEQEAPLRIIDGTPPPSGTQNPNSYESSSSLSEDDDDGGNNEQLVTLQQEAPPKMRRMHGLQRMSSQGADSNSSNSQRAPSSQNSSRDWGWFFGDLHLDENGNPIPQNSEKGGKDDISSKSDGNGGAFCVWLKTELEHGNLLWIIFSFCLPFPLPQNHPQT